MVAETGSSVDMATCISGFLSIPVRECLVKSKLEPEPIPWLWIFNSTFLSLDQMAQRYFTVFVMMALWLPTTNFANGQDSGVENSLQDFLARFSDPEVRSLPIKLSKRGGDEEPSQGHFRSHGNLAISATIEDGTERRWIRNRDYVAEIERKPDQATWMLSKVSPANTGALAAALETSNHAGYFFGGGMLKRFEFLELVGVTNQSDGTVIEYRYTPECPVYSSDAALNSLSMLFDKHSEKARLLEIKHWEGGGEMKIESVTKYEYPEDSLFPIKRVAKAIIHGGEVNGSSEMLIEDTMEIDNETRFDSSECYLTHYGLPEPEYARNSDHWDWWLILLITLLVGGIGAYLWKRNAGSL